MAQRSVPLKDQSEAESSFARMSKKFSRSLKNLMQMDGKTYENPSFLDFKDTLFFRKSKIYRNW